MPKAYLNKNILLRMPNWLGDAVMATPVLSDMRKRWPEAKISITCKPHIAPLFWGNPHVDHILPLEFPKQEIYDLGVLLTHSFSSAWQFWKAPIKERVGFRRDFRNFLLTKGGIRYPKEAGREHLVVTYKRLLKPLGIEISDTAPELFVTEKEQSAATDYLKQLGVPKDAVIIGINPTAAYGPAKCWPKERFQQITKKLCSQFYVLYFGDKLGAPTVSEICQDMPSNVINLAGKTSLRELIALLQKCHLILTNDSGPMHLAAALKRPLVALFGSTNPTATGPYKHGTIVHKKVECSPCYKRTCPIDFRCMLRIEVDEVYQTILNELHKSI